MAQTRLSDLLVFSLLFVSAIAIGQTPSEQRLVTAQDLFTIKQVANPSISPEGDWVAYTVRDTDLEKDEAETRLWMSSTRTAEVMPMTGVGSSVSEPRWSPDGKYLSFMASRNDGESQVWALNRRGGEAIQLTEVKQGIQAYEWSPDGQRLLLVIRDPQAEEAEQGVEEKPTPWVIDRLQFKRDYAGYLDNRRSHLYVQELESGELRQLTWGDFDDSQPAWSPDGESIAFVSNRTAQADANSNSDIWLVSAYGPESEASSSTNSLTQITSNPGSDSQPAWSPDGQSLTYVTVTEPDIIWYATSHLGLSPATGGSARVLTNRLDRNVNSPRFSADGSKILFVLEDSGERHLAAIDTSGENFERLISGQLSLRDYSQNENGQLAALIGASDQPAEVYFQDSNGLRQLSSVNKTVLDSLQLAAVENVQFPSADGTEIEAFIYKPPGFDPNEKYPALLRIHGGPVAQYDFNFNFEAQLFAANGYVVVMTNPRGSSGYGQDFSLGIWQAWGTKDFEDVMAGVDYILEQGYADSARLGVGGWSYGGILTNYVITKTQRFSGAITGASEVLFRSNYGHDHYQRQWEAELGLPWENAAAWEQISPFNDVANITTPTLVMGGEKDWNVPILNSEQLYQALKRLGRETQLVVYPGESHGINKPSFQLDRLQRYLAWYDQYVKRTAE